MNVLASRSKNKPRDIIVRTVIPALLGCVAGYGICSTLGISEPQPPIATTETSPLPVPAVKKIQTAPAKIVHESVPNAEVDALKNRIRQLERELAKYDDAAKEQATAEPEQKENRPPMERGNRGFEEFRERMERMKTEDPERYKEITERQQNFRNQIHEQNAARNDFLTSINTDGMTEAQKANHKQLLEALAFCNEAMDYMGPDVEEPLTEEERTKLGEHMRSLGPLMENERRYIFEDLGKTYGVDGAEFADYIQTVLDSTSMWGPRMMGGPGMHGGPGMRGGRGSRGGQRRQ